MKKFFLFLLIGMLICGVAAASGDDSRRRVRSTVVTADDADVTVTNAAGESFDEDRDVLLGFTVFGGQGCFVGIYDVTTLGEASATNLVAEAETTNAVRNTETVWFEYPVSFTNGITVVFNDTEMNDTYGVVLYWERNRAQYN